MERVIKFRAWDVVAKQMVYDGAFQFEQFPKHPLAPPDIRQRIFPFDGIESGEMVTKDCLNGWYLMQFTGLTDKAGREIYEKDRYKWTEKSDGTGNYEIGEIIFEDGIFWCKSLEYNGEPNDSNRFTLHSMKEEIEIIGNSFTPITKK